MNSNMKTGDLLYRSKGFVEHTGVYLWGNKILHNSPRNGTEIVTGEVFSNGQDVSIVSTQLCNRQELTKRLYEVLNTKSNYHFALNNCEHVANYIIYGRKFSPQIRATLGGAFIGYLLSDKEDTGNQLLMLAVGGVIGCSLSNVLKTQNSRVNYGSRERLFFCG